MRQRTRRTHLEPGQHATAQTSQTKPNKTELAALIRRFPLPSTYALASNLAGIVLGNAYLLWQVGHGELSLTGLILLVACEVMLLTLLEALQRARVPADHRMRYEVEQRALPGKASVWAGFVIGIGGAYLLWIVLAKEVDVLIDYGTDWRIWRRSGLDIALGITLAFALVGLMADHAHYRRHAPPLVSVVSMEAMTRRLTFAYGAVVIAIPMIGLTALALWCVARIVGKRDSPTANLLGGLTVIATFFTVFFILARAVDSGPVGWTGVYLLGKVIVEALFAVLPILARHAAPAKPP